MGGEDALGGSPFPSLDFRPRLPPFSLPSALHWCLLPSWSCDLESTGNGWRLGHAGVTSSHTALPTDHLPSQSTLMTPQNTRLIQGQGHHRSEHRELSRVSYLVPALGDPAALHVQASWLFQTRCLAKYPWLASNFWPFSSASPRAKITDVRRHGWVPPALQYTPGLLLPPQTETLASWS